MSTAEAPALEESWDGYSLSDDTRLAELANQGLEVAAPRSNGTLREFVGAVKHEFARRERLTLAVGALGIVATAAGVATGRKIFST